MNLPTQFTDQMLKMARNFGRELTAIELAETFEYFIAGKKWTLSDFAAACDSCVEDLKFYPKIAELIERRPRKYRTIEDIEADAGTLAPRITQTDQDEIDDLIDQLKGPLKEACRKLVGSYPKDGHIRQPRYACHECLDTGVIEVYDARAVYRKARDKALVTGDLRTCMTACQCEAGQIHRIPQTTNKNRTPFRPMIAYDQKQMCRVQSPTSAGQVAEVTSFMQTWNPRNYHSEFADWG